MMIMKFEYIKSNLSVVRKLIKSGDISGKIMMEYKVYGCYQNHKKEKSKMQRYQNVADEMKTSLQSVMRAVKSMEDKL